MRRVHQPKIRAQIAIYAAGRIVRLYDRRMARRIPRTFVVSRSLVQFPGFSYDEELDVMVFRPALSASSRWGTENPGDRRDRRSKRVHIWPDRPPDDGTVGRAIRDAVAHAPVDW
jgi:hypothetical protein